MDDEESYSDTNSSSDETEEESGSEGEMEEEELNEELSEVVLVGGKPMTKWMTNWQNLNKWTLQCPANFPHSKTIHHKPGLKDGEWEQ